MLQPAVRPATAGSIRLITEARRLTADNYGIVSQRRACISTETRAAAAPANRELNLTVGRPCSHVWIVVYYTTTFVSCWCFVLDDQYRLAFQL